MPDPNETKDQTQTAGTQEVKTEQNQQTEKSEEIKPPELPKKDFFKGNKMDKWLKDKEVYEDKLKKKAEQVGKTETQQTTETKTETQAIEQGKKPFKVLKVSGKDVPVWTEKEHDDLAQMGLHYTQERQKDSEWEKDLKKRTDDLKAMEEKLEKIGQPLVEIMNKVKAGEIQLPKTETQIKDEILDNEDLDPATREILKKQDTEIKALKENLSKVQTKSQEVAFKETRDTLEKFVLDAKSKYPFDDIKSEEGQNITAELFSGLVVSKVNMERNRASADKSFEPRSMEEIIDETGKQMQGISNFYKTKYSATTTSEPMTKERLAKEHPDIFEAIKKDGATSYLAHKEETTSPTAISTTRETKTGKEKKEIKSLKDAFDQAEKDEELMSNLADWGRKQSSAIEREKQ